MGVVLFLLGTVFEIAFTAFCIITKSNQRQLRNIVRIAAFIGFLLFTALSVINWSFRYYTIAAFLLLLAVVGTVGLARKKKEKRAYKAVRVILKAIGMTMVFFVITLPAIIFPQHKTINPTGQYQVATASYTYKDTSRVETYTNTGENRRLTVEMWYPKNTDGTYPLIVFSHGSLGIKTSNETLYNELASNGYIVCSIDHTYQCFFTTDADGRTTLLNMGFFQELMTELTKDDRQFSYECYQKWMGIRMGDINFVIDQILSEAKRDHSDRVYKLVDTTEIGVMGHSLGGSAALGIGRIRNDVSAVIELEAPFMNDIKGVKDGRFVFLDEIYPVPLLNVYSDDSWSHLDEWPEYVENYTLLSGGNANIFNIHIRGVGHLSLTDLSLDSPILTNLVNGHKSTTDTEYCLKTLNRLCLEFFNCYLKGEDEFRPVDTY